MKIKDILGISNAKLIVGNEEELFDHFSKDTRTIKEGDTYLAFSGENFDGNLFFEDAFLKGAKTCVLSKLDHIDEVKSKYADKNIILVDHSLEFIIEVAKLKRKSIHVPVVAITGSVGKTSTKNLVASILEKKYRVLKTEGNMNTRIGLALTLLGYQDEECIVVEVGMNQRGEISTLSQMARPDVAIITNIGTSHIGNLGSRENILKAKLEILDGLTGPIIVNNDNDLLHEWAMKEQKQEVITFGIDEESLYQAKDVFYSLKGSTFTINDTKFLLPVFSKAFIYNALVAYIIGHMFGVENEQIAQVFQEIKPEAHRMEKIDDHGITILDDSYNASYDSLFFALDVLSHFINRKVAVLGDIFELGDYSEQIHRNVGHLVCENQVDLLVTVGKEAQLINEEAVKSGFEANKSFHFTSNEEACLFLHDALKENDVVLVKASHGMNFAGIVEYLVNERD